VLPREPLATPEVELYYKLGREYWGQGYAAEACRAMIRFAFDEMRLARIVTITATENTPSIKLTQALGMRIDPAPPSWIGSMTGTLQNDRC
jgi:RimJ/RimL family protein N-acetyltransferase